jgi:hypothetical protein
MFAFYGARCARAVARGPLPVARSSRPGHHAARQCVARTVLWSGGREVCTERSRSGRRVLGKNRVPGENRGPKRAPLHKRRREISRACGAERGAREQTTANGQRSTYFSFGNFTRFSNTAANRSPTFARRAGIVRMVYFMGSSFLVISLHFSGAETGAPSIARGE